MAAQVVIKADVTLRSAGKPWKSYEASNEQERAAAVREANNDAQSNDVIICGPGVFDFGTEENFKCKDGVTYTGMGQATYWIFGGESDHIGTCVALGDRNVVSHMQINHIPFNIHEDGRLIGWDNERAEESLSGIIHNCKLIENDWTVYNWMQNRKLTISDCYLQFGRFGVVAAWSGGHPQGPFNVIRCHFDGDGTRSKSVGASSSEEKGGVLGCINRRGLMRIIDCSFDLKGAATQDAPGGAKSYCPRVAAITDQYGNPGNTTEFEVFNLRSKVTPNGTPSDNVWDWDVTGVNTSWRQAGPAWGSADNGGWINRMS